jgi:hypothetical protein
VIRQQSAVTEGTRAAFETEIVFTHEGAEWFLEQRRGAAQAIPALTEAFRRLR